MTTRALSFAGWYVYCLAAIADAEPNVLNNIIMLGTALLAALLIILVQSAILRSHLRNAVNEEAKKLVTHHAEVCRAELDVRIADLESDMATLGDLDRQVTRLEQCVKDLKESLQKRP
jgi:hypothetical protein